MHDIDHVTNKQSYVYENIKKGQKKAERRDKIIFFIKWFTLGLILGGIITFLTN